MTNANTDTVLDPMEVARQYRKIANDPETIKDLVLFTIQDGKGDALFGALSKMMAGSIGKRNEADYYASIHALRLAMHKTILKQAEMDTGYE